MRYLIVILIMIMCGCDILKSHNRYVLENKEDICANLCSQPIDTETNISSKDTTYITIDNTYLGADSMMLSLYMYCNSDNQVLIKNSELLQSRYGRMIFSHNKDVYTIRALYDSVEVKNKTIHELKIKTDTVTTKVPVYVEKIIKERYVPWWVYFLFAISGIITLYLFFRNIIK